MNPLKTIPPKTTRITVLGGLGEIGMNCLALETEKSIIIIDCGVYFTELEIFGVDYIIPNFSYLIDRKDKIKGYVITHAHEDHIGALPFAFREGLIAPIYCTRFASRLVQDRMKDRGMDEKIDFKIINESDRFKIGDFSVETQPVNHSIVEALAVAVESPGGRILHTGDFKIDPDPLYGKPLDLDWFRSLGEKGVDLLLSDSTNVEVDHPSGGEKELLPIFKKTISEAKGLLVMSMFSSHIPRIASVLDIAESLKKKVILAGRSMHENVRHAVASGYLKKGKSLIVQAEEFDHLDRNDIVLLTTGSQGEFRSALWKLSQSAHRDFDVGAGDSIIVSSRFIPGNEQSISRMINNLYRLGAEIYYEPIHHVHVSGHATKPELEQVLNAVKPRNFIPIHGEYRHLVRHARLAQAMGVVKGVVAIAQNGEVFDLNSQDGLKKVHEFENPWQMIDELGEKISKTVLRHRRQLAEAGAIALGFARDSESGRIGSDLRIQSKGIWDLESDPKNMPKSLKDFQQKLKKLMSKNPDASNDEFNEWFRIESRKLISKFDDQRRPSVFPMIVDSD